MFIVHKASHYNTEANNYSKYDERLFSLHISPLIVQNSLMYHQVGLLLPTRESLIYLQRMQT